MRDLRGSIIGWTLGLSAYAALLTAAFPSIRDNDAVEAYIESLPEAMLAFFGGADITSVAGFFQTELFSYLPVLLAVFTIGKAIALTVGEERDGTMDLVLAQPIDRWRVIVARSLGLAAATTIVLAGVATTLAIGGMIVGMTGREILGLVAWCFLAGLPALVFGAAALAVAGVTHRARGPLIAAATLAAGSFLIDGLSRTVDVLDAVRPANPYHWYALTNPVTGEASWWGLAGLVLLTLVLVTLAAVGYERKDIGR